MRDSYRKFLSKNETDCRGVFDQAAQEYQVPPEYIEKDFWVCISFKRSTL